MGLIWASVIEMSDANWDTAILFSLIIIKLARIRPPLDDVLYHSLYARNFSAGLPLHNLSHVFLVHDVSNRSISSQLDLSHVPPK